MKQKLFIWLFVSCFINAHAQDKTATRKAQYNLSGKRPALEGYDPVSYFSGKPVKGNATYALTIQGVSYHFATPQNNLTFQRNPTRFEPQYGGWCAFAMGNDGSKVDVDPETYKIVNGKLYLFYNSFLNNTLKTWNKKENELMKSADANWANYYH